MTHAAQKLRRSVRLFVRRFGLLSPNRTPCGAPLGLSHAHGLVMLQDATSPMLQKELATTLGLDKSSVNRLCGRMLEEGHIQLSPHPSDGRARVVSLTTKGKRLADKIDTESLSRFKALLEAIPKENRTSVVEALDVLNTALTQLDGADP